MELGEFQKRAKRTNGRTTIGGNHYVYLTMGLAGEAGELANKVKKIFRDDNGQVTKVRKGELISELGDILWYIAMLSEEFGSSLEEVAVMNNKKLKERLARGTVHGSGDKR